jgi:glycerol-3-phosphate dehydrogenase
MARDAVDAVLGAGETRRRPSSTAELPIVGAAPVSDLDAMAARLSTMRDIGMPSARSLVGRHGTEAEALVADGAARGLDWPLAKELPFLESEVAWAAEQELAQSLEDVLVRRIRLAPELRDRGASIAPRVAAILGPILGWDERRQAREIAAYLVAAHRQFDVPA